MPRGQVEYGKGNYRRSERDFLPSRSRSYMGPEKFTTKLYPPFKGRLMISSGDPASMPDQPILPGHSRSIEISCPGAYIWGAPEPSIPSHRDKISWGK
mgnify:CR=1 FL=1